MLCQRVTCGPVCGQSRNCAEPDITLSTLHFAVRIQNILAPDAIPRFKSFACFVHTSLLPPPNLIGHCFSSQFQRLLARDPTGKSALEQHLIEADQATDANDWKFRLVTANPTLGNIQEFCDLSDGQKPLLT